MLQMKHMKMENITQDQIQSYVLFFINGVQLAFTWKGQNKDIKIWLSVAKMDKKMGNSAKKWKKIEELGD